MQWNILLVDDDSTITSSLRRLLHAEPWQIFLAADAEEALSILLQHEIHVLVTDFQMPIMDGVELCQQARDLSPNTYRIMLSGEVDYPALQEAWKQGDVHRFVAKPWDNQTLKLTLHEGIRRHLLLRQGHQLLHHLSHHSALLMTDQNWVVRYASVPMQNLLAPHHLDLIGMNLFGPSLSAMPVALEAEVTWQTEHDQTWIGDFSFQTGNHMLNTRMTINPLGENFRVVLCEQIKEENMPPQNLRHELQRYSGEHQLYLLQQDAAKDDEILRLLRIEFALTDIKNLHAASVLNILHELIGAQNNIYTPQKNLFLIRLANDIDLAELEQNILTQLHANGIQLTPVISLEQQPDNNEYQVDWLRAQLGFKQPIPHPEPKHSPQPTPNVQFFARPFFNQRGQITALTPELDGHSDLNTWKLWLEEADSHWRTHFSVPLSIILSAHSNQADAIKPFLGALMSTQLRHQRQIYILLQEDDLLGKEPPQSDFRETLLRAGCQLVLDNFGTGSHSMKQLQHVPLVAVCLSHEFLQQLDISKNSQQEKRTLQRLQEQGVLTFVALVDNTDLLIIARNNNVDWLSGDLLSTTISLSQLSWFDAPTGE